MRPIMDLPQRKAQGRARPEVLVLNPRLLHPIKSASLIACLLQSQEFEVTPHIASPFLRTIFTITLLLLPMVASAEDDAASSAGTGAADPLELPESEFATLFDAETLGGWVGAKDAYEIRNGMIVNRRGAAGNLFTENTYGDFEFRFEFRLSPGANSGIGIRSPLEGDSAYVGIELQVLDNTAEKYVNLQPYQYHGSAYGIAPAKRGALKPVGEWNEQFIRCVGSQLRVILNGETILDVDLERAAPDGKTADGRDHPGLERRRGHIGLLGHGDVVEFRNLRICELGQEDRAETPGDAEH